MAKVVCVGFDKLSPDQQAKIDMLVKSAGPALIEVHCFNNLDVSDMDDVPSGIAMFFDPNAKVDSTLISDNMFQMLAASRVLGGPDESMPLKDEYFRGCAAAIGECVHQHPELPVSGSIRHPVTVLDKSAWAPELGGPGSFVGAYYQPRENLRDKDYYIVARSTVPLVVRDLKTAIREEQPTYRDLMFGDRWKPVVRNALYTSRRNVHRSIANAAEACNVSVMRMDDIGAKLENIDHAPPESAVPDWEQNTYSMSAATLRGRVVTAMYNGVIPQNECQLMAKDKFFVVSNPYDGIHVFPLSGPISASAIPADTGRSVTAVDITVAHVQRAIADRSDGVVWEKKTEHPHHVDLAPNAFRPISQAFKSQMKNCGWDAERHMSAMIPLAIKIFNPELKRNLLT